MTRFAVASRRGTRRWNCDYALAFRADDGTVGAALVDGIGNNARVAYTARLCAETAARVGARRGPLAGLLSAGELVADPAAAANGVGVLAVAHPDGRVEVGWVGDCRAYGWDGTRLRRYTDDHTVGEQLRRNHGRGVPLEVAEAHNNWITTSLAHAVVATVYHVKIPDRLILLTSDGIHDQVDHAALTALVASGDHVDLQTLADAVVAAAVGVESYRDDATVIVMTLGSD